MTKNKQKTPKLTLVTPKTSFAEMAKFIIEYLHKDEIIEMSEYIVKENKKYEGKFKISGTKKSLVDQLKIVPTSIIHENLSVFVDDDDFHDDEDEE